MAGSRALSTRVRRSVEELFEQGVTEVAEVCDRLDNKISRQQVGGLLTLWRRRLAGQGAFPAPLRPEAPHLEATGRETVPMTPASTVAAPATVTATQPAHQDAFDFGQAPPTALKGDSFGFGTPAVEYHIRRTGPTLVGFLGVEPDPFDPVTLGNKYGSGIYQITKYINGQRVGYPAPLTIADTFGVPRSPRPTSSYPRLRPYDDPDEAARERERERQRDAEHSRRNGPAELSETVSAVKQIHDMVSDKKGAPAAQTPVDLLLTFFQQQQAKADADRAAERDRWEREQKADRDKWEREKKDKDDRDARDRVDAERRHKEEMDKVKNDHLFRMAEAERQAKDRETAERAAREHQEKQDREYRQFVEKLDKEREQRLDKAVSEAHGAAASVQVTMKEERELDRKHDKELGELRRVELENERTRITNDLSMQREHLQQMYELQLKAIPAQSGDGTKMICEVIKDAVGKADEHAKTVEEIRKTQALVAALGPEKAQQLAQQLLTGGGVDLARVLPGQKAAAAPAAAAPANGQANATGGTGGNGNGKAADSKGDGMNGIAAQVIETPFFKDLLEIWGGQLRMKRTPYLFVDQLCGFMIEDKRVQLFYNYMAGKPWDEFWPEVKSKADPAMVQHFETPEAAVFFAQVIDLIAQRVERDHIDRGIVQSNGTQPAPVAEVSAK